MHTKQTGTLRHTVMLAALLAAGAATARPQLLPPQSGDLASTAVVAPSAMQKSAGAPNTRPEPVSLNWATQAPSAAPVPFVGQSREYYQEVSADDLAAGVDIHTSAPRALVRIQPIAAPGTAEKQAVAPLSLTVRDAGGRSFAAGSGMDLLVSAEQMSKAGSAFGPGTSAFRLDPKLGSGAFKLSSGANRGSGRYLINVVEPDSKVAFTLQTGAPNYLHGQQLVVLPDLVEQVAGNGERRHAIGKLEGYVTSPGGRMFPLAFHTRTDGRPGATLVLDANEAPSPGLWEVHATSSATVAGQTVMRSLRYAFGVAMPVARLNGAVSMLNVQDAVGVRLGVDVGAPGRYEVRAQLYGMRGGVMQPVAMAHAAQWMNAGTGSITLEYDAAVMAGARGPFELRDLTLLDQGRMGLLQRQQRGVTIDERDVLRSGRRSVAPAPSKMKQAADARVKP
ncbi:DUF4785 domain-containing protein [Massilia sp. CF038]|uniref:DUF4785 domain-containing protein n=1 Tax=Massilia sp. CF038 TaxID=1881045 RepID=UPI000921F855|nr:DUF4785 domain-containing protein [Massilia sp. CF038]SHG70796.1 protein of unknown function [Massilia sp. CF038]